MQKKTPVLVILGPTAVGKSAIAVKIATELNGEVISADSRQIYTGLDIGTGKITQTEMSGIKHHLLDVAEPQERFSVMRWKELAEQAIADIHSRGRLPIMCGGTGFYISALIDNIGFPDVQSDPAEQKALEEKSPEELVTILHELDPVRADAMQSKNEHLNKRRMARSIIIARSLGSVPALKQSESSPYNALLIGITTSDEELKKRIQTRFDDRMKMGMVEEVESLHKPAPEGKGLSFERMEELGLEYRFISYYLKKEITQAQLSTMLPSKIWQYARRQKTWFKRDNRIQWLENNKIEEITAAIKTWLQKVDNKLTKGE